MASSLFRNSAGNQQIRNSVASQGYTRSGLQAAFDRMYAANQNFRSFADSMRGKTPEQAFREMGFDFSQYSGLIR